MVVVVAFYVGNTTPTLFHALRTEFLNQSDFTDITSPSQKHLVEHTPWMPDTAAVALTLLSTALLPLLLEWLMNFEPFYLCRNTALTAFLQYAATKHSMSWGRAHFKTSSSHLYMTL